MTDVAPTETASGVPEHIFISETAIKMLLAKAWEDGRDQGRMDATEGLRMDFIAEMIRPSRPYRPVEGWFDMKLMSYQMKTRTQAFRENPWKE